MERKDNVHPLRKAGGSASLVALGIIILALIGASFESWYTVDQRERAVTLRNGAITGVAEPGLHFKLPFVDSYARVSTQSHVVKFEQVEAYSRDQQPATLVVSVTYSVPADRVDMLYARYGSIPSMSARLLERKVPDQVKTIFGQFTAISAVQDRAKLTMGISDALRHSVEDQPIHIEGVQIEEIGYSPAYEASVEDRMKAEVAVFTRQQNLETERINAQIAVTQAKGRADSVVAEAQARAQAVRLAGEAEAAAIEAKGKALRENPSLVQLIAAEQWDGKLPGTMVPGSAVPFISVK
ncbi:prohibitin family protein [Castellaniella hirudinis]|uniref:Prohibitin family protein n=1 Tax=Castellaniella hirudinis TaxID=1144617 RepID=A0ABV8S4T0_9BURK